MAEKDDLLEQDELYQWLETLDLDRPLSELVEHADVLEPSQFEPEELERLEELGREYAGELFERNAIPDLPPMDIDEHLLEPEQTPDLGHDLDYDLDR
jgi:hypothetical protein